MTVKENVNVATALSKDHYDAKERLEIVGLKNMQDKYPKQLSSYEYVFQNDHTYEDEAIRIEAHPDYTKDGYCFRT